MFVEQSAHPQPQQPPQLQLRQQPQPQPQQPQQQRRQQQPLLQQPLPQLQLQSHLLVEVQEAQGQWVAEAGVEVEAAPVPGTSDK